MSPPACAVSDEIFSRNPGYVRGVVIAEGVTNGPASDEVEKLLRKAEESVPARVELEDLAGHPRIAPWCQAAHPAIGLETRSLEINIDGLPPVAQSEIEEACAETGELVTRFCGGRIRYALLSHNEPHVELTV